MASFKDVIVKHNQSLYDISIQEFGSVEGVFWLLEDNETLYSPVDIIEAGDVLKIRDDAMHVPIKEELKHFEIVSGGVDTRPEGIGFWRIQEDFIVQ